MERRKFIQLGSSIGLGLLFAGGTGYGVWTAVKHPNRLFHDSRVTVGTEEERTESGTSPYRMMSSFEVDAPIRALELYRGNLVLATDSYLRFCGISGEVQQEYPIAEGVRDIAIYEDQIYLLYPTRILVLDVLGQKVSEWEACSDESDYCQLAVCQGGVYVTDAGSKNVCQYTLTGGLVRFINSPSGFVVPSYCFGIAEHEGIIYCSNPGRHLIEKYDQEGNFLESFGKTGKKPGAFSGCCNPVYITFSEQGELFTSEKGVSRICCYGKDGTFHSQLLDSKQMNSGHKACEMRMLGDKLIVANANRIQVYKYKKVQGESSMCGSCTLDCPLKRNISE